MEPGKNGSAEAGPSTGQARVKKKAKPKQGKAVSRHKTIPKPYLALAPAPVSLSGSRFHEAESSSSLGNLVLPSSYPRGAGLGLAGPTVPSGPMVMTSAGPSRHAPTGKTRKYAAGLLAPPAIMPGGVSAFPRIQAAARNGRRTPGDAPEDIHRNRSTERLRQISGSGANASMMSLGHVGRILQSDPSAPQPIQLQDDGPVPEQVSTRRRRRIVREEGDNIRRRTLTVSTREEGRAMGLARGASMRRLNVWDDLPESSDPPPAFPFPTNAANPNPPTFETAQSSPPATSPDERPRSPPPSFEQATGLVPLPIPLAVVIEADEDEPVTVIPSEQETETSRPTTPATDYASAQESPSGSTTAPLPEVEDEERSDRRMWNMDLLSGYNLEERVRREMVRRKSREEDAPIDVPSAEASSAESSEQLASNSVQEAPAAPTEPVTPPKTTRPRPVINTAEESIARGPNPSSPARPSPLSASTPRSSTRTLHLSRSTSRLATSPQTPTARVSSPGRDLIMASTMANPPTAVKLPTSPVSPTSPSSPLATLRQSIQSPKTGDPEAVVDQSPPSRKLSRGHAIRRSSSVLKSDTGSIRSRQSTGSPKQPLFSSPGLTASQILDSPEPHRVKFEHRASESSVVPLSSQAIGSKVHQRTMSQPNLQRISEDGASADVLPPHREAALKRRDLGIARVASNPQVEPLAPMTPTKTTKGTSQPSGPLIDFNHTLPAITTQPPAPNLGEHSDWTTELLQLLDEVQSPIAESSSQAAARTAAAAIVKAEVEAVVEAKVVAEQQAAEMQLALPTREPPSAETASSPSPSLGRKRAPPPPPPFSLRLKRQQGVDKSPSGVVRRPSVLSTANSPIIPLTVRPSTLRHQEPQESPTPEVRGQSVPTRRPPPLPPVKFQPLAPAGPSAPSPSPPPPSFIARPSLSQVASFSTSESSEEVPAVPERPLIPRRPYTSLATRPRGPRPPPTPARPWSKVVSQTWQEPQRASPVARSPPGQSLAIRTDDVERPQPPRSASVQDLRSPHRQRSDGRSPIEFTDLDVFVSRLEGTGREYEGFAQITSFLGPGKPTAATPAQIATLLPGLVSVDSRRTNPQGKVKLKLSLLGVRVIKCPICLSQFKDKDTGVMLPECSHVAHQVCATRWFRDESRCFVCREALKEA